MSRNETAPNRGNDGQHSDTTTSDGEPAEGFIATEITAVSADLNITTETVDGNVSVMITGGGDGGNTVSRLFLEPDRTRQESPGDSPYRAYRTVLLRLLLLRGDGAGACGLSQNHDKGTTTESWPLLEARGNRHTGLSPGAQRRQSMRVILYIILW